MVSHYKMVSLQMMSPQNVIPEAGRPLASDATGLKIDKMSGLRDVYLPSCLVFSPL